MLFFLYVHHSRIYQLMTQPAEMCQLLSIICLIGYDGALMDDMSLECYSNIYIVVLLLALELKCCCLLSGLWVFLGLNSQKIRRFGIGKKTIVVADFNRVRARFAFMNRRVSPAEQTSVLWKVPGEGSG